MSIRPVKFGPRPQQNSQAGFTLVEVLMAMFIFSLISVGTMSALTNMISAKESIKLRLDEIGRLEIGRALIADDMANIVRRHNRDAYGGDELYVLTGGVDELLEFTRGGRANPGGQPRGDLQRVRYVFEDGQMIRRALAHENPSPVTAEFDQVLLSGLVSLDLEFIVEGQARTAFFLEPGSDDNMPSMIRLNALFEGGGRMVQYFEIAS